MKRGLPGKERRRLPPNVSVTPDVSLGNRVRLSPFVNLYGCTIGEGSRLGAFVEIQRGARVGACCKVSSNSFICSGVEIEDEVFIGHGVIFINDRYPRATNSDGSTQTEADWQMERTVVRKKASIGSGAIIMCGVEIGEQATVGAGAVVTRDVAPNATVAGCPARLMRSMISSPPAPSPATSKGDSSQERIRGSTDGSHAHQDG